MKFYEVRDDIIGDSLGVVTSKYEAIELMISHYNKLCKGEVTLMYELIEMDITVNVDTVRRLLAREGGYVNKETSLFYNVRDGKAKIN